MKLTVCREQLSTRILCMLLLSIGAVRCAGQTDTTGAQPVSPAPIETTAQAPQVDNASDASQSTAMQPMATPSVVSGAGSSMAFTSETERSNYLRGGATATAAYQDNVFSLIGNVGSEVSYTVGPFLSLDLTRPRTRLD